MTDASETRHPNFQAGYGAADPAVPFGGYKMSGYGRESGRNHIDAYLETKSVWVSIGS